MIWLFIVGLFAFSVFLFFRGMRQAGFLGSLVVIAVMVTGGYFYGFWGVLAAPLALAAALSIIVAVMSIIEAIFFS